MKTRHYWVEKLDLQAHPEGGYYKETYRAESQHQFEGFSTARNVATGIYFLLTQGNFSAFHRIKSDEMWHFYDGSPIEVICINEVGELSTIHLGLDVEHGEVPQAVVPANVWFASRVTKGDYALVGCTVAPGFDFKDFELAERKQLIEKFPVHRAVITALTRV